MTCVSCRVNNWSLAEDIELENFSKYVLGKYNTTRKMNVQSMMLATVNFFSGHLVIKIAIANSQDVPWDGSDQAIDQMIMFCMVTCGDNLYKCVFYEWINL